MHGSHEFDVSRPKSCTGLFTCSHLLAWPPPPHQQLSSSSSHILLNFYWHCPPFPNSAERLPRLPSTDSCNFSIVLTIHEQHSDYMTAHLLQSRGGIQVEIPSWSSLLLMESWILLILLFGALTLQIFQEKLRFHKNCLAGILHTSKASKRTINVPFTSPLVTLAILWFLNLS